ncbi:MAG: kynureninase [Frankiaceae bacterium]
MTDSPTRADAERLDAGDPLRSYRDRFVIADPDLLYLDGNSLGRLPVGTGDALSRMVAEEWGEALIRSWHHWIDLPNEVGDLIGTRLLGARPGETAVSDSTTVNLYKLAAAAVGARPGRRVVVTDDDNFPTDRYVLQGLCQERGLELRTVRTDIDSGIDAATVAAAVDGDTALVSLSHVAYRSGAVAPLGEITALAHDAGALVLWDLSHAAGAVPVGLAEHDVDLAVGCTYKYLNGGPGSPAFLYVRRDLQERLRQPIWGWFGQRGQFEMGEAYDPQPDIRRFLVGTPPVLTLCTIREGAALLAEAGIDRLRAKGVALTDLLIRLADAWLVPLGFRLASPRDPARRGSHVALHHPDAYRICRALIEQAGVIPDFRTPDRVRLGPAPVTTRFVDVHDAMARLRDLVASGAHEQYDDTRLAVT